MCRFWLPPPPEIYCRPPPVTTKPVGHVTVSVQLEFAAQFAVVALCVIDPVAAIEPTPLNDTVAPFAIVLPDAPEVIATVFTVRVLPLATVTMPTTVLVPSPMNMY